MTSSYYDPLMKLVNATYRGICDNNPQYFGFKSISPTDELLDIHHVKNLNPERIRAQTRLAQVQHTLRALSLPIPLPAFNPLPEQLHVIFFPEDLKEDIKDAYNSMPRVINNYAHTIANALHASNKGLVLDFLYTGIPFEDPLSKFYCEALQNQAHDFKRQKEAVFRLLESSTRSHLLKARKGSGKILLHPLGKYFVPTPKELQKTLQDKLETTAPHGTLFEKTL